MLRYLSLFSGIGAFEKALTNLGVKYEVVNYCEIDKYASKSYSAIHGISESKNLWDITKINLFNLPKDIDLLTYGFPCQDISLAGKQKGMFNEDGTLTRSGLFFKALNVIEYVKPKIAIAENVKALTSKKFSEEFKTVLDSLEKAGYHNYWKVLNAKDYGIPQNRERVFIVSIRKDIDHNIFEFPKPYSLEKRLKDFLEPQVDEKYYLSDKIQSRFILNDETFTKNVIGSTKPDFRTIGQRDNGYNVNAVMGSLVATDYKQPKQILIREKTKKGYTEAQDGDGVYINRPHQKRGVVQKGMIQTIKTSPDIGVVVNAEIKPKLVGGIGDKKSNGGSQYYQQDRIYDSESIAMAHPANLPGGSYKYLVKDKLGNEIPLHKDTKQLRETIQNCELEQGKALNLDLYNRASYEESQTITESYHNSQRLFDGLRIRKLSPLECWRLMGFSDEDFEKAKAVPTSNTQLYKQAGNSIVVDVLEEIFCMMLDGDNLLV